MHNFPTNMSWGRRIVIPMFFETMIFVAVLLSVVWQSCFISGCP